MTTVSFINQFNSSQSFSIAYEEDLKTEEEGECILSFTRPFIVMENPDMPEFIEIWMTHKVDVLFGESDQLWGIVTTNNNIAGSGAIVEIIDPDLISISETLNGVTYDDLLILDLSSDREEVLLYLQKDAGLIAFDYQDEFWILE